MPVWQHRMPLPFLTIFYLVMTEVMSVLCEAAGGNEWRRRVYDAINSQTKDD